MSLSFELLEAVLEMGLWLLEILIPSTPFPGLPQKN